VATDDDSSVTDDDFEDDPFANLVCYPGTLKKGSSGDAVKKVQDLLGIEVSGYFGDETKEAVTDYQQAIKDRGVYIEVDGIVGPHTWGFITGFIVSQKCRDVSSVTGIVKRVQTILNATVGDTVGTLSVDGIYGPKTEAAVKEFQEKENLASGRIVGLPQDSLIKVEKANEAIEKSDRRACTVRKPLR
jgi:peptidoglycan hydrolase-like protein with peptidoglycan-binding domain